MFKRKPPAYGNVLTPEDIDLEFMEICVELYADPLDRLAEEILESAKRANH